MLFVFPIFDSRGNKTIRAILQVDNQKIISSTPSGKSTGKSEVVAFPKNSVDKAISFFELHKKDYVKLFRQCCNQKEFDDGLKQIDAGFLNGGASLSLALSILFMKYQAYNEGLDVFELLNPKAKECDLPKPLGNVIGGGLHSNNNMSVQEILAIHLDKDVFENISKNIEVYKNIEQNLRNKKLFFAKNDEGAITSTIGLKDALDLFESAALKDTRLGMDIAASSFYKDGKYYFENKKYDENEFIDVLLGLIKQYKKLMFVEDPLDEDAFNGFAKLQSKTGILICGDDLYTTNVERLKKGIKNKSSNAILIKPNQIGTLTDTYNAVALAKKNDMVPVISHRSGETDETIISHLAVGWKIPFIKTGTMSGERMVKLNELIQIRNTIRNM